MIALESMFILLLVSYFYSTVETLHLQRRTGPERSSSPIKLSADLIKGERS